MKQKKRIKWHWSHVEWAAFEGGDYQYYIYWQPNWLPKDLRYWGLKKYYYDGTHVSFGFWFFNVSWSTPWTEDVPFL